MWIYGLFIPILGTTIGAATVFFLRGNLSDRFSRVLTGFAAGVMVAASVWSLLIPAMNYSASYGKLAFVPAVVGFWGGILLMLFLDFIIPHLHLNSDKPEGPDFKLKKSTMLILAVTLHNLPEGMAVGAVYTGLAAGNSGITLAAAFALSIGIAIQNLPEGAIISAPLNAGGMSKIKSFFYGFLSGIIEPIGALLTVAAASLVLPVLPYLLSFSAGAMIYVVVEELIPEMSQGNHSNVGGIAFSAGFTLIKALDVALA